MNAILRLSLVADELIEDSFLNKALILMLNRNIGKRA
jgi:hypothetical protein